MKDKSQLFLLLVLFFTTNACGTFGQDTFTSNDIVREATFIPGAFLPPEGIAFDNTSCKNPLIDPQDGEEIRMIRSSASSFGDYEVPEGKYGVKKNELLRINCKTGEVVGIVLR